MKLLLKSISIQPGAAILPNSPSSLATLLSSCCSFQCSTDQSTTDTRFTHKSECLYAVNLNIWKHVRHCLSVKSSLNPRIKANASISFMRAISVNRGVPPHLCRSSSSVAGLSSPVKLLLFTADIVGAKSSHPSSFCRRLSQAAHQTPSSTLATAPDISTVQTGRITDHTSLLSMLEGHATGGLSVLG